MTTETLLRQTLRRAAAAIPDHDTPAERIVRRGRRRRNRNRGTVVAGVAALAVTAEQISQLRSALALDGSVTDVRLETQQQAYERFAELFADQPELVESVSADALPASLRIALVEGAPSTTS